MCGSRVRSSAVVPVFAMTNKQITMWQQMADMTFAKCKAACKNIAQCCNTIYCEMAADAMTEAGHEFPKMPFGKTFVVDGKCIVPPHFRPLCSLQQCKISSLGGDPLDLEWTEKYFELRDKLDQSYKAYKPRKPGKPPRRS